MNMSMTNPAGDSDDRQQPGPGAGQDGQANTASDGNNGRRRGDEAGGSRKRRERPKDDQLPTRNEVLLAIKNLPSLVATGVITTAQSNAMLASLKTLLDNLDDGKEQASVPQGAMPSLLDAIRRNPDLLHVLERLLTDEQLRELADDDDDEAAGH